MTTGLVAIGKPMGNGHPMSAVATSERIPDDFGSTNEFFNTFAGNPVSRRFRGFAGRYDFVRLAKGAGLFLGLDFALDGAPATRV